jgi:hypothetical protein
MAGTAEGLRRFVFGVFMLGLVGMEVELVLLEHTDGAWQWTPIVMIALAIAVASWHALTHNKRSVRAQQWLMLLFVACGLAGIALHLKGNLEFELELHAGEGGWLLLREALMGATPTLAPGVMLQLGLLGLAWSFRHPALDDSRTPHTGNES